jgi:hypothetical protein
MDGVLTLSRVVQMSIQPLRGVRVVVGRRLGHVLLVRVVLGQGGPGDGTPGKRTGTVRRGRLAERFLILDLYDVRGRKRKIKPSRDQRNEISLGTKSIQIESIRVEEIELGVNDILTLAVNVGMFPETILHRLELFDAIHALGFLVAVYETGKGGLEVFTAGALGHPAEALSSRGGFGSWSRSERGKQRHGKGKRQTSIWVKKSSLISSHELTGQSQLISPVSSL